MWLSLYLDVILRTTSFLFHFHPSHVHILTSSSVSVTCPNEPVIDTLIFEWPLSLWSLLDSNNHLGAFLTHCNCVAFLDCVQHCQLTVAHICCKCDVRKKWLILGRPQHHSFGSRSLFCNLPFPCTHIFKLGPIYVDCWRIFVQSFFLSQFWALQTFY